MVRFSRTCSSGATCPRTGATENNFRKLIKTKFLEKTRTYQGLQLSNLGEHKRFRIYFWRNMCSDLRLQEQQLEKLKPNYVAIFQMFQYKN